jgi:hypothetical protein
MHEIPVKKHISNQLVWSEKNRPDIMQGKKVFYVRRSRALESPLNEKNDHIDDNQVLDNGRNNLGTPQTEVGHIATEITGCKLMF